MAAVVDEIKVAARAAADWVSDEFRKPVVVRQTEEVQTRRLTTE